MPMGYSRGMPPEYIMTQNIMVRVSAKRKESAQSGNV
eukprot:CAMPEP_0180553132 /NCGR_PEP_ID=MMETSP1036_2-20121128/74118_1 /TAXON_ID=632150 /ORGANISM="Azadinium spinosum, Strain 3D9" /LENGTH=36 /DNA_ID= /DNA_START= /DNA_END= /DNA_ORIENTATION=